MTHTTKDEALDLALEALEHMLEDAKQERLTVEYWNECVDAITAIKQALAAPVQEFVCSTGLCHYKTQPAPVKVWEAEGYDALMKEMQVVKARNIRQHAEIERLSALVRAQQITIDKLEAQTAPVQEPVAWMHVAAHMPSNRHLEWNENHPGYRGDWIKQPLYTTPPATQRQWVSLTDEDIGKACGFAEHTTDSTRFALKAISRAIEAKLKEKNSD